MKAKAALSTLLLILENCCLGQAAGPEIAQNGFSGSVHQALTYVGRTFKIPFVAECDAASDKQVTLPPGPLNGAAALNGILAQTGLASTFVSGASYIYDQSVVGDPADQLTHVFPYFAVPRDGDAFLGLLFARLHNDFGKPPDDPTIGFSIGSNLGNDALKGKLKEEKIDYISARDLLLREAGASHSFWAVVCYAKSAKDAVSTSNKQIPPEGIWSWGETAPMHK